MSNSISVRLRSVYLVGLLIAATLSGCIASDDSVNTRAPSVESLGRVQVSQGQAFEIYGEKKLEQDASTIVFAPALPRDDKIMIEVLQQSIEKVFGIRPSTAAHLAGDTHKYLVIGDKPHEFIVLITKDSESGNVVGATIRPVSR